MIFLDTHAAIWLYCGEVEKFSDHALYTLQSEDLFISPMVRLELQYLFEIGRIAKAPKAVLEVLLTDFNLRIHPIDFAAVAEKAVLETWTRDPFDRIIVAHARDQSAALISRDSEIQKNYTRALG